MCDTCDAVATATFTILPEPGTGRVALLRDGVELGTFRTQAEAFAYGAGYVALSSGSGVGSPERMGVQARGNGYGSWLGKVW